MWNFKGGYLACKIVFNCRTYEWLLSPDPTNTHVSSSTVHKHRHVSIPYRNQEDFVSLYSDSKIGSEYLSRSPKSKLLQACPSFTHWGYVGMRRADHT